MDDDQKCFRDIGAGGASARKAIATLHNRYARKFLGRLVRKGFASEQAEDIVQDTFVKLVRLQSRGIETEYPGAYLWKMLDNCSMDFLRSQRVAADSDPLPDPNQFSDSVNLAKLTVSHDEVIERHDFLLCFQKVLQLFRAEHPESATVIDLAVIEGYSGKELAEALGRTYGATREFLSQCRRKFSALLADRCHDYVC